MAKNFYSQKEFDEAVRYFMDKIDPPTSVRKAMIATFKKEYMTPERIKARADFLASVPQKEIKS